MVRVIPFSSISKPLTGKTSIEFHRKLEMAETANEVLRKHKENENERIYNIPGHPNEPQISFCHKFP